MTQLTRVPSAHLPIRIISHNIRFAASPSQRLRNEQPWSERLMPLSQQLHLLTRLSFAPLHSIICLQEVLVGQFNDIRATLGDGWSSYGVGRDDGYQDGEMCAIFWRTESWNCIHRETVWLNETGKVGKKGWDAGSVRIVSCVILEAKAINGGLSRQVLIMNTHLDNSGLLARREGAKILLGALHKLRTEWSVDGYFLAGDLNSECRGDAYKILAGQGSGLRDAKLCFPSTSFDRYGDSETYTGFDGHGDGEDVVRIDFIFVPDQVSQQMWRCEIAGYATLSNLISGFRMSDHQAVVVDALV